MTDDQIKAEFNRWIETGRPDVWVKSKVDDEWAKVRCPEWYEYNYYIVDDIHARLRILQIDKPDTIFEYYDERSDDFFPESLPKWDINTEYRVKPKEW